MSNILIPFDNFSPEPSAKFLAWKTWISKKVKEVRESHNCCIGMLSVLSGLPEEYIHKVETAEISPSNLALTKICISLGVPKETFNPPANLRL